jgi:hypothetical protein
MKTLYELGEAVIQIREAIEQLTITGASNAAIIVYCNGKCNDIVAAINAAAKTAPPGDIEIKIEEREADLNGDNS